MLNIGCHPLALNLLAHWSFDRVIPNVRPRVDELSTSVTSEVTVGRPRSPTTSRTALGLRFERAPSLVIDMEIPSLPATRPTSPSPQTVTDTKGSSVAGTVVQEDPEAKARKSGLGTLMKSAKKDVQVAEFDMNAFF